MRHGSLFSGIGGFELAAEWMGWENVFHCEWNPFGQKVLHHYWPNSEQFTDIKTSNFEKYANKIDILTGGFPCQPYSSAGKRLGKNDERHLWPYMLRAIQQIKPTYIVGENVRGLTNWNGGVVFEEVCTDLENCGYEVQPILLPACSVGAPHRRDRIWFIAANTNSIRCDKCECINEVNTSEGRINAFNDIEQDDGSRIIANTNRANNKTLPQRRVLEQSHKEGKARRFGNESTSGNWIHFPTQSPICSGDDGLPTELDGITFSKWRKESLMAYGNAIVPQVAFEIFKAIETTYTSNTYEKH